MFCLRYLIKIMSIICIKYYFELCILNKHIPIYLILGLFRELFIHCNNRPLISFQSVRRTLKLLCKCHGVSGSCTTKTCWQQLAHFRSVGNHLRKRYAKAVKIDFQNAALHETKNKRRGRFSREDRLDFRKTDLVFLDSSPDYCFNNGSHQTLGRQCSKPLKTNLVSQLEKTSCVVLCQSCGLMVKTREVQVETSCQCKFYWCCSVDCKTCKDREELLTCSLD